MEEEHAEVNPLLTMAGRHHERPDGVTRNINSKEETGEKGEAMDQVPRTCSRVEHE